MRLAVAVRPLGEKVERGLRIEAETHADRTKRLDFAGKIETTVNNCVVERLLPCSIARCEQAPACAIPKDDSPHPVEALEASLAPLGIRLKDDLRIARRAKLSSDAFQFIAQLTIVVDLAV